MHKIKSAKNVSSYKALTSGITWQINASQLNRANNVTLTSNTVYENDKTLTINGNPQNQRSILR